MRPLLQTLLFTACVPGTVAGLVPWLLRGRAAPPAPSGPFWLGAALLATGAAVYLHTAFWGFALRGRGSPAPVAPTARLVVEGLHRRVRNPMYLGVLLMVAGQASIFWSSALLAYALALAVLFHLFVLLYEEPTLHRQFGGDYEEYLRRVPRWIPRP
ncbi:MAG TPA: isoprenylcysteine carboxylmethyltransferase family protein [Anaeromyxobacteraceae bacterium]|nr:isoprenylcysteine carboxylmethyltransferase family protein [Anaeromyxobacteraceae bacterium]